MRLAFEANLLFVQILLNATHESPLAKGMMEHFDDTGS